MGKEIFRVIIFSTVQTLALPLFLLPFGIFLFVYFIELYAMSIALFFIPILLSAMIARFAFPKFGLRRKFKTAGIITALVCLFISCYLIFTERGSDEYFGNNLPTYLQLILTAALGYIHWNFSSRRYFPDPS
jgi:hypothetical protein